MKLDRSMDFYFGVDVARGSLRDAAIRARQFYKEGKLEHAIFAVADLGADVLGHDQKLLTWKMEDDDTRHEPEFRMIRGGGISSSNRFDVVSIQFAIHYMMSSRERARHFFHTVSKLLEVGGNLICTTIDARIVMKKLMGLGLDLRFKDDETPNFGKAVVETGSGACKITFEPHIVKKIFTSTSTGRDLSDDMFGLEYTFTLVEGSDHAAGVGDAVNLPEWLTPIPVLEGLANEAGLELEYAQNFHEFYTQRKDVVEYQNLLRKMKALNRTGSISKDEWAISGLYAALKFRKVEESKISVNEQDEEKKKNITIEEARKSSNFPRAMLKARRSAGDDWNSMSQSAKDALTIKELQKLG
jgi:mRNA (guanine-N7-)-methyltransferase